MVNYMVLQNGYNGQQYTRVSRGDVFWGRQLLERCLSVWVPDDGSPCFVGGHIGMAGDVFRCFMAFPSLTGEHHDKPLDFRI